MKDRTQQKLLHSHYLNLREMLQAGFPKRGVQKSFEELVYAVMGKNSWRPTHISINAITEYVEGTSRNIQRAHGAVDNRIDRYERTMTLLEGVENDFNVWWDFFVENDKTVLITRKEHSSGKKFTYNELTKLPDWSEGMFENSGFSVRLRKKTEGYWLYKQYQIVKENKDCES